MTAVGHFRQINPLPTLSACPLRSDRVRTFAPQRIDAVCDSIAIEIFPILGQATAPIEPSDRAFDDPTLGQRHEPFCLIGTFDDFGFEVGQGLDERRMEDRPRIGAIGEQLYEKRELAEQCREQRDTAVAILNASGMNDRVQQQTLHVDENMPFLALDQLARVEPVRIDTGPPFSALFTLWLSMMQAVGLASRSTFSRHSTYSA